jgi:plastocyanin
MSFPAPEPALITTKDFTFKIAAVAPGEKVTVKNQDCQSHTVTSAHGRFDVSAPVGGTASFTAPTEPVSYPFSCTVHANMMGTLVVR